jgi:hypothetical protein
MIKLNVFARLSKVLPRCSVLVSAGDLMIIDRNNEIIGQINGKAKCITVYRDYPYAKQVTSRLKRTSLTVELIDQPMMEQAAKILYDYP